MCSDESHFNVSLIVRDKVTRQSPQTATFLKSRKGELKRNRAEILLLTRLVRTRSRLYWERERERERERDSLCRVSVFLCSVGVDCMTAPTPSPPPPPPPKHTHTTHPPSAAWTAWLTFSPPPTAPPPPPTHTTDIAQPPRAVLTARLSCLCVCSTQLCWRSRGLLHLFLRTAAPAVPTRRPLQQQHRVLWLGCQYGLRWQQVTDHGLPSTRTTAAKSTATQKWPTKRLQRFW